MMFADYTTPVLSHSNFSSLIKDANVGLTAYATWFGLNKLSLNKKNLTLSFSVEKNHIPRTYLKLQLSQLRCLKCLLQDSWELLLMRV